MASDWVGLSDEEIVSKAMHLSGLGTRPDVLDFARAIEAKLREKNAGKPSREWQPIDTAPKDGTVIDLWHNEFGRFSGCYWGLPHHNCGEAGPYCDSDWHDLSEGWVDSFNQITFPPDEYTHWIPLPAEPEKNAGKPATKNILLLAQGSGEDETITAISPLCEECGGDGYVLSSQAKFDCPVCNDKDQDNHAVCKPDAMKIAGVVGIKFSPEQFSGVLTAEIADFELEAFAALYRQAILASQAASVTTAAKVGGQS